MHSVSLLSTIRYVVNLEKGQVWRKSVLIMQLCAVNGLHTLSFDEVGLLSFLNCSYWLRCASGLRHAFHMGRSASKTKQWVVEKSWQFCSSLSLFLSKAHRFPFHLPSISSLLFSVAKSWGSTMKSSIGSFWSLSRVYIYDENSTIILVCIVPGLGSNKVRNYLVSCLAPFSSEVP